MSTRPGNGHDESGGLKTTPDDFRATVTELIARARANPREVLAEILSEPDRDTADLADSTLLVKSAEYRAARVEVAMQFMRHALIKHCGLTNDQLEAGDDHEVGLAAFNLTRSDAEEVLQRIHEKTVQLLTFHQSSRIRILHRELAELFVARAQTLKDTEAARRLWGANESPPADVVRWVRNHRLLPVDGSPVSEKRPRWGRRLAAIAAIVLGGVLIAHNLWNRPDLAGPRALLSPGDGQTQGTGQERTLFWDDLGDGPILTVPLDFKEGSAPATDVRCTVKVTFDFEECRVEQPDIICRTDGASFDIARSETERIGEYEILVTAGDRTWNTVVRRK